MHNPGTDLVARKHRDPIIQPWPAAQTYDEMSSLELEHLFRLQGIFYPDNENRARRVDELINDIVNMQQNCITAADQLKRQNERLIPLLDELLKKNGLKSYEELLKKMEEVLEPEDRERFRRVAEFARQQDESLSTGFYATTMMAFITLGFVGRIQAIEMLVVGGIGWHAELILSAMKTLATNWAAGRHAMAATMQSARIWAQMAVGRYPRFVQFIRIGSRIAKIIGWIAAPISLILLIISLVQGAQQREELQRAITDLFVQRLVARVQAEQIAIVNTQSGIGESYLLLASRNVNGSNDEALAELSKLFIDRVKSGWAGISEEASYKSLKTMDEQRKSWMNEDPSYERTIELINETEPDDDPEALPHLVSLRSTEVRRHVNKEHHEEGRITYLFVDDNQEILPLGIFYPDNENRGRRLDQLIDDITNFEQNCVEEADRLDRTDIRIRPALNRYLARAGFKTFDDLLEYIANLLPEEDKEKFRKMAREAREAGKEIEQISEIFFAIAAASVSYIGIVRLAELISAGGIGLLSRQIGAAVRIMVKFGLSAGAKAFAAVRATAGALGAFARLGGGAALRFANLAGKFLSVVGKIATALGFLALALSLIVGASQKTELQKSIIDLASRRVLSKLWSQYAVIASKSTTFIESILTLEDINSGGQFDSAIQALYEQMIVAITSEWDRLSVPQTFELLAEFDSKRDSWRDDDPSLQRIEEIIQDANPVQIDLLPFDEKRTLRVEPFFGGFEREMRREKHIREGLLIEGKYRRPE